MAVSKLILTFGNGKTKQYKLRFVEDLKNIDPSRKVEFIFLISKMKIYDGYSNGHIDKEGNIFIKDSPSDENGVSFPVDRLMGWRYLKKK